MNDGVGTVRMGALRTSVGRVLAGKVMLEGPLVPPDEIVAGGHWLLDATLTLYESALPVCQGCMVPLYDVAVLVMLLVVIREASV